MELDKFFVITGPSAVGKTTLARELLKAKLPLAKVITTTTRTMRKGERDGREYHFITPKKFQQLIAKNQMFEWATYNNHYYGSQKKDVEKLVKSGKFPLWVVDVQGAIFLKEQYPEACTIFITPSAFDTLRKRLEARNLPKEEILSRLKIARKEIAEAPYFTHRIINYDGKLEKIVSEATDLIQREITNC